MCDPTLAGRRGERPGEVPRLTHTRRRAGAWIRSERSDLLVAVVACSVAVVGCGGLDAATAPGLCLSCAIEPTAGTSQWGQMRPSFLAVSR